MNTPAPTDRYKNHRFPPEIISHGVWTALVRTASVCAILDDGGL
jgi:hypothetical protein